MSLSQNIKDIKRFDQIVAVLFKNEFGLMIDRLRLKDRLTLHERLRKEEFLKINAQPYRVRKIFEELGGSFVKLGQLLSLRPDLIPKEYSDELKKLQDNVAPFSYTEAKAIIEGELKTPVKDVFSAFFEKPMAAASIGQVHEAVLKKNNKRVVVKVQRPNIGEIMKSDIDLLYHLAALIEKHFPPRLFNPTQIVKEFEDYSLKELDYIREGKNIESILKNHRHDKKVVIPEVYWEYTTEKVLTMGFIDGEKISEVHKLREQDRKKILSNLVNTIFEQIFIDGFFHADPHPGNILILKENRIGLLDFGIIGHIDEKLRRNITSLFIGMIDGDLSEMADSLLKLGFLEYEIDEEKIKQDLYDSLGEYHNIPLKNIDISSVFHKIIGLAQKDKIRLPTNFILLVKSTITLEGVAREIDPNFNIVAEAKPFVKKIAKREFSTNEIYRRLIKHGTEIKDFILEFPEKTTQLLHRLKEADEGIKSIHSDIKTLTIEVDRSSNRVTFGLLITALLISSALLLPYNQFLIFGISAFSFIGFLVSAVLILFLFISIAREKR